MVKIMADNLTHTPQHPQSNAMHISMFFYWFWAVPAKHDGKGFYGLYTDTKQTSTTPFHTNVLGKNGGKICLTCELCLQLRIRALELRSILAIYAACNKAHNHIHITIHHYALNLWCTNNTSNILSQWIMHRLVARLPADEKSCTFSPLAYNAIAIFHEPEGVYVTAKP